MKRIILLLLTLSLLGSLTGCGRTFPVSLPSLEADMSETSGVSVSSEATDVEPESSQELTAEEALSTPGTSSVSPETENDYDLLYEAASSGAAECRLEGASMEEAQAALKKLLEQPELFWLEGGKTTAYTRGGVPEYVDITLNHRYTELADKRAALETRTDGILSSVPEDASDYEKAKLIHDYLVTHITYGGGSAQGQDIYAALVEGQCVCRGYVNAYTYLMNCLDIECFPVTGTSEGVSHAWNCLLLDGAYYYTDVTWDDADTFREDGSELIYYTWFNVTLEDISNRHQAENNALLPGADADALNYYTVQSAWLEEYTLEAVRAALSLQAENGTGLLTLRCRNAECYNAALYGLFEEQEIYGVLRELGYERNSIQYYLEESLYVITLQV